GRRIKVTDKRRARTDPQHEERTLDPRGPVISTGSKGRGVAESEVTREELDQARREAAEYREHLQRLQAEFDNYRKRVIKEQTRTMDMAPEPLVRKLLEVLDEFDLALMHAERNPEFDKLLHGVELVYATRKDMLRRAGREQT